MPYCCVPLCKNSSYNKPEGTKFHRFPVDEKQCQKWIKLIRRKNYQWSMNSFICSWHFPEGKEAGPTRFHWNVDKSFKLIGISQESNSRKKKVRCVQTEVCSEMTEPINSNLIETDSQIDILKITLAAKEIEIVSLTKQITDKDNEMIIMKRKTLELEDELRYVKYKLSKQEAENSQLKEELEVQNKENHINQAKHNSPPARTEDYTPLSFTRARGYGRKTLVAYTGMQSLSSFEVMSTILVTKRFVYQTSERVISLCLEDQIFLLLIKLKLDLPHLVLADLFQVSQKTVSKMISSLLSVFHDFFYLGEGPLAKIPSRQKNSLLLPKCFSDMQNCRIILDCTEVRMEAAQNLHTKKITFSNYKSMHTMKVLIGCAPNGTVTFVSDLFGGSESDKSIVSNSGVLLQMAPGDTILADKGFELFDILPQGVSLNIPSFLDKDQFTLNETIRNRSIARARVIVERLNARFKVFRILECIRAENRKNADYIVKVCVALTTLMPTLMNELNELLA